jgi:hypothetical protein
MTGIGRVSRARRVGFAAMAAFTLSRVHAGWSRSTQAASAAGCSNRMHPWLKSRRCLAKSAVSGVPCR